MTSNAGTAELRGRERVLLAALSGAVVDAQEMRALPR